MTASYEVWLTTDTGVRIAQLDNFVHLTCGRSVNAIGRFSLQLPRTFDESFVARPDRMVQIWRQPTGGRLGLWRVYFIRRWQFQMSGSDETLTVSGPDTNDLLRRRIVAAYSGSSQASKTDYADDMMKEIVTESLADGVAPTPTAGTRVWSNLSVAADLSAGPTLTKGFAFEYLLTGSGQGILPALAKAAREAGEEVFFDIVPNVVSANSITFRFETYTGQPGQDVSDRVVFSQENGNLQDPAYEEDYEEEANYFYAAGPGEEAARLIQQVYDTTRYGASIWNRCEGFADARNQTTEEGVRESGRAALEEGRPKIRFNAVPVDTAGTRFGRDWDAGYRVTAKCRYFEADFIIRAVTVSVNDRGDEDVQTRLDYEG